MQVNQMRSAALTAVSLLWCLYAHAELGGAPMLLPADDPAATARVIRSINGVPSGTGEYTVREIKLVSGTVIHEYASAPGIVFGLAWQGPSMPNFASILGRHFPRYTAGVEAAHAAHGWRAPVSVNTSDLVIRTGGHMGAFWGQAWLPATLPARLTGNDIQ
ncbi:DUF2844 domain-containing protein [Burkholderia cepacia]|uniref:DUF2844 domain-containing protein n=1 Tax=Burkholderia cepacia TaxID=292 RepID=UPI001CF32798|nr:DUF2844 domain-containing protein [Burkholderia cepacia]MCA8318591.1 DUF2844 domain-containing protein [Burkholderia cepacia]